MKWRVLSGMTGAMVVAGVLFFATAAQAAQCGTQADGESEPLSGALLFQEETSDLNLDFEKGTGEKRLLLIFEVTGCKLASAEGITAKANGGDLPKSTFGPFSAEADGKYLEVEIPVAAGEFNPGKYAGTVRVSGASIVPVVQSITLQRSEEPLVPSLIVLFFALGGLVAAAAVAKAGPYKSEKLTLLRVGSALVAVFIAAAAVWKGTYADAEIWKPDAVSVLVLILAVGPAAFGAATGVFAAKGATPAK